MQSKTKAILLMILILTLMKEPLFPKDFQGRVVYFENSMEKSEEQKQKMEESIHRETKTAPKIQLFPEPNHETNARPEENYGKSEILKIEEEWNRYSPVNLKQLASKLTTLGAIKQKFRDYKAAIRFYDQSLAIRERLGEKQSEEYALTLYLRSIAQSRIGNTCQFRIDIQSVIEIYRQLRETDSAILAEDTLKKYSSFCEEK
ncbi:tetratricopeptide repeat protein [Leptospira sp. 201903070]|uniref:Tetratricopeptide repeat protein n=1 Tax=Leptospira ainlahdjerensis TaxID=2810033 RepID=A0ABS2UF02_9LEPT|nr:tetratricopeptide repeat protein [Leptospira ainlahdjerensis]MBM9577802.1 tetratricopeptide repeat protein [Leptospira ainlahdjerensis]